MLRVSDKISFRVGIGLGSNWEGWASGWAVGCVCRWDGMFLEGSRNQNGAYVVVNGGIWVVFLGLWKDMGFWGAGGGLRS